MITFSNAKINLGLQVKFRRDDGFHELETLFYPVPLNDILEILPANELSISQSGPFAIDCKIEENLVYKAWKLLNEKYQIEPVQIVLHKNIPSGAGLGGGSSNAAFTLKLLNKMYNLSLNIRKLKTYAAKLGSDCAFFIDNKPAMGSGRGEKLHIIDFSLKDKYIALIVPDIHVSTAEAYGGIKPQMPEKNLSNILQNPTLWKNDLKNDFEPHIFVAHPQLKSIKEALYENGAIYAAMSGSGSSMFGIFDTEPRNLQAENIRLQKVFKLA
jgi:4-diphosphocytidyl-2-C-methyl-D-erythritol kinase